MSLLANIVLHGTLWTVPTCRTFLRSQGACLCACACVYLTLHSLVFALLPLGSILLLATVLLQDHSQSLSAWRSDEKLVHEPALAFMLQVRAVHCCSCTVAESSAASVAHITDRCKGFNMTGDRAGIVSPAQRVLLQTTSANYPPLIYRLPAAASGGGGARAG